MSGDHFTRDKFTWLEQVAKDASLPPSAARVAIVLAGYLNRETGDAWPSIGRLCTDLELSDRGVQKALVALLDGDHLARKTGGGRSTTSRYSIILSAVKPRTDVQGIDQKPRTHVHPIEAKLRTDVHPLEQETPNRCSQKPRTPVHPTPYRETIEDRDSSNLSLEGSFAEFYRQYPRRVSKRDAEKAYAKALKRGASPADILAGAMRYAAAREGQDRRYTAHPSTWLNGNRWEDEPEQPRPMNGHSTKPSAMDALVSIRGFDA